MGGTFSPEGLWFLIGGALLFFSVLWAEQARRNRARKMENLSLEEGFLRLEQERLAKAEAASLSAEPVQNRSEAATQTEHAEVDPGNSQ